MFKTNRHFQWKAIHFFPVTTKSSSGCCGTQSVNQPNRANECTVSLHWENCTCIKWAWYILIVLLIESSAFLELQVHPTSLNCFPTKFRYTSVKFKFIILYISSNHKATITTNYFSLHSFSKYVPKQWNSGNRIFFINSFEFKLGKCYVILNGEIKVFSSNMGPVHIDQGGE